LLYVRASYNIDDFFVDRVFTVIFKGFYLVGLTGRKLTENAIMV